MGCQSISAAPTNTTDGFGSVAYHPPSELRVDNESFAERSIDTIRQSLIYHLPAIGLTVSRARTDESFVIVTYSGSPERYVDCGSIAVSAPTGNAPPSSVAAADPETQFQSLGRGFGRVLDRKMRLDSRMVVQFRPLDSETGTLVVTDATYVMTKMLTSRDSNGWPLARSRETISFGTSSAGTFASGTTCRSTGQLEGRVLDAASAVVIEVADFRLFVSEIRTDDTAVDGQETPQPLGAARPDRAAVETAGLEPSAAALTPAPPAISEAVGAARPDQGVVNSPGMDFLRSRTSSPPQTAAEAGGIRPDTTGPVVAGPRPVAAVETAALESPRSAPLTPAQPATPAAAAAASPEQAAVNTPGTEFLRSRTSSPAQATAGAGGTPDSAGLPDPPSLVVAGIPDPSLLAPAVSAPTVPPELESNVIAAAETVPCSRIRPSINPDGSVVLTGFVPSRSDAEQFSNRLGQMPGVRRVDNRLAIERWPYCEALNIVAPYGSSSIGPISVVGRGNNEVAEGDQLAVLIDRVYAGSHLLLSYFQADGQVVHIGPITPDLLWSVGAKALTLETNFIIAPPVGRELLIAFVSRQPLFDRPRPRFEPAEDYLADLRVRLRELQNQTVGVHGPIALPVSVTSVPRS